MAKKKGQSKGNAQANDRPAETDTGLRHPPLPGELVFSLRMHVDKNEKAAVISQNRAGRTVLAESDVMQPGQDFGVIASCQTCTLFLDNGSGFEIGGKPNTKKDVKVKLAMRSSGDPLIIIK